MFKEPLSCLMTLCSMFVQTSSVGQDLIIAINLNKEEFYKAEPVVLHVEVKNQSSKECQPNDAILSSDAFRLMVLDEEDKELERRISSYHIGRRTKRGLPPGESFDYFYDVSSYFGVDDTVNRLLGYLSPGMYSIQAMYFPFDDQAAILSNKVSISIVKPADVEEPVSKIWLEALRLRFTDQGKQIPLLTTIVTEHAESVFHTPALSLLVHEYISGKDSTNAHAVLQRLLSENPEGLLAWTATLSFISKMSVARKQEFLHELANNHPSTFIGRMSLKLERKHDHK